MISFSNLGNRGRLGNSLFQIASLTGIANKLGTQAVFPRWKYERYFKNKLPRMHKHKRTLWEPHFHYSDDWFEDEKDYDGWLQSDKYFESKESVKKLFEFETGFKELVRSKYRRQFEKPVICVSIRRGDFIGNPNYEYLPVKFYIGALLKLDWQNSNILFFSDDISYCRTHFECLPNAHFIQDDPIEQLCLMTLCDYHVISQSTFSWWGAYLSESKRVIRPSYNFTEHYKGLGNDDKDYFPQEWEAFDHKPYKIDLGATFIIPVQYDHKDREDNLNLIVKSLHNDFKTTVFICENQTERFFKYDELKGFEYLKTSFPKFHRTKMLNLMTRRTGTEAVINYDADVLVPPMSIYYSVHLLKEFDIVYPYDGRFARVPRRWFPEVLRYLDCGVISRMQFEGMRDHDLRSVGGAVVFNKSKYLKGGGENENFISYGAEDVERFERFSRLGFRIHRVKGALYHMDHFIGIDSYIHHDDYKGNQAELERVRNLTNDELEKEFNKKRMEI